MVGVQSVRSRPRTAGVALAVLLLVASLVVLAIWEGDVPEGFSDIGAFVVGLVRRFGAPASLALLYIEETGIPLPVPGDVYVAYIGSQTAGSALRWIAGWLGIIVVVTAGATNLFLISRRWGRRLLEHRLAPMFHLDEHNLARAEAAFRRWGVLAIIFGRHLPGFRIPITVVAGVSGVSYRVFAPSVAVSTAAWAGIWMYLGRRYARELSHFFAAHRWIYLVAIVVIMVPISLLVVRALRLGRREGGGAAAGTAAP